MEIVIVMDVLIGVEVLVIIVCGVVMAQCRDSMAPVVVVVMAG